MSTLLGHADGGSDFAVCPPEAANDGSTLVEVRLLRDDRAVVDQFLAGIVDLDRQGGMMLGKRSSQHRVRLQTQSGSVGGPLVSLLEARSWHDLFSTAAPLQRFTLHFESPTFWRSGKRQLLMPLPASVLRSLQQRWASYASDLAPQLRIRSEMTVTSFRGETVAVRMSSERWTGFVGEVQYELEHPTEHDVETLGKLMSAAHFTGVGSMVAYGFGVVAVE